MTPQDAPGSVPMENNDPPLVRCGMCGGRCRWEGGGWISCRRCAWASGDPRRRGLLWRLRVAVGR